jgi:hypothetical protein
LKTFMADREHFQGKQLNTVGIDDIPQALRL